MKSICHFFYTHIIYGLFGFGSCQDSKRNQWRQAGNVFTMLFGAVGMVGVVGAASMTIMKGPVKTMSEVTKKTIAENNMMATTKLAMIVSSNDPGTYDCDDDEILEPVEYGPDIPGFTGGGQVPAIIGTTSKDPWGTDYAYCAWDYGPSINQLGCTGDRRRRGGANSDQFVLAVISAGPDKVFSSSCVDYVNSTTPVVSKAPGTDDLVLGYTEADAYAMSGGLWTVKTGDPDTAEIQKKLEVTDAANAAQFQFDAASKTLTIGDGGTGSGLFPLVRADVIDDYNQDGSAISVMSPLTVSGDTNVTGNTSVTGSISGASVNAGSGTIQTTGTVMGGTIRNSANSGYINSGGAFVGTSLNAGSGTIQTDGTVMGDTIRNSANTGRITTAGALVGTSLNAGTGTIQTDGTVMGDLLRTSSNAGRIDNAGAITGTSVTVTGGGTISGTHTGNGAGMTNLNADNLTSGTVPNARLTGNYSGLGTVSASLFSGPINIGSGAITSSAGTLRDGGGGWVRTYGGTGWYNGTYAGGWYMSDTTWVRSYSNKNVYTGGILRGDTGIHTNQICNTGGGACVSQSALGSSTPNRCWVAGSGYVPIGWSSGTYCSAGCPAGGCGNAWGSYVTPTCVAAGANGARMHNYTSGSCSVSCGGFCGDRDEAREDLPWFGTSTSKMKACFEGMLASGNLFDSSTPSSQNMSCSDIK